MWKIIISILVIFADAEPEKITFIPEKPLFQEPGDCLAQGNKIAEGVAAVVRSRGITALRVEGLDGKSFVSPEIQNFCGHVEVKLATK